MDSDAVVGLNVYPARRHRLNRRDFYRLGEIGILRADDRVELLEGQLIDMLPIGPRHAIVTDNLNELLVTSSAGRARVRRQDPVVLDDGSEPQPDLVLARRVWAGYPDAHPGAADILLLVEVADRSLDFDRRVKLGLYARACVPEVWIVDLTADVVWVYRGPTEGEYGSVVAVAAPEEIAVAGLPGVVISVAEVFGVGG